MASPSGHGRCGPGDTNPLVHNCKQLAAPISQPVQSLNAPFPPIFNYKAYSKDNSSFPASMPEARLFRHKRIMAENELGKDCANKGHDKNKILQARAGDDPADVEKGPLIDQAAINLDKVKTTGSATELVIRKAQPARCEAISTTARAETQVRRHQTISLNVEYGMVRRIAAGCSATHNLAANERIMARVLRETFNQGHNHNRDQSILRLGIISPIKSSGYG